MLPAKANSTAGFQAGPVLYWLIFIVENILLNIGVPIFYPELIQLNTDYLSPVLQIKNFINNEYNFRKFTLQPLWRKVTHDGST